MNPNEITELAFRVEETYNIALRQQNLTPESLEEVARRMQQIRAGLAPEREFVAAVNWLSHVSTIHRLGQTPLPTYNGKRSLRIPDVLAIVRYSGHLVPVLIEVKATKEDVLVWSEEYLQSLQRYASAVKLPLLIAWKYLHIWALTEVRQFKNQKTAYHLDCNTAMRA